MADPYFMYYMRQAEGRNAASFHSATMKGDGLGSFLGNLFRRIFPLLSSGAKAVGKEAVSTGVNLLKDALNGRNIKESMYDRVGQAGKNLTEKAAKKMEGMVGNGYKRRRRKKKPQSRSVTKRRRVCKKASKKRKSRTVVKRNRDIFS